MSSSADRIDRLRRKLAARAAANALSFTKPTWLREIEARIAAARAAAAGEAHSVGEQAQPGAPAASSAHRSTQTTSDAL